MSESHMGEKNATSKFTNDDILEIRSKYTAGVYGYRKLAKEYNVSAGTICSILKYRTWKHVL